MSAHMAQQAARSSAAAPPCAAGRRSRCGAAGRPATSCVPAGAAPRRARCDGRAHGAVCCAAGDAAAAAAGAEPRDGDAGRLPRRSALAGAAVAAAAAALLPARAARAFERAPAGYEFWTDTLDGYAFLYPADWVQVRTAGADVFFRAPLKVEESVFVEASSPSSRKYGSLLELGAPDAAAAELLQQYLSEFASTRLGVRREASVLSSAPRTGADGRDYLDVEINVKSYAAQQQYGVTAEARGPQALEWDRRLLTTLGVANGRLYQLRLQANEERLEEVRPAFRAVMESFRVFEAAA